MRRAAALAAVVLLVTGVAAVAMAATKTAADDFSSGGYGGSTGSVDWAGDWSEFGDSGGAGGGAVKVEPGSTCASGHCLTMAPLVGLTRLGAQRDVDLADATSARLRYHIDFPGGLLVGGTVVVEVRSNGSWIELHSHGPGTTGSRTASLPVGGRVTVRFTARDLSLIPQIGIDDVTVELEVPDPTTTTSTTTTSTSTSTSSTLTSTTTTTVAARPSPTSTTRPDRAAPGADPREAPPEPTTADDTPSRPEPTPPRVPSTTAPEESTEESDGTTGGPTGASGSTSTTTPTRAPAEPGGEDPSTPGGAMTDLDPRLGTRWSAEAQDDLLVRFGLAVEDIALDILASAVLGLVLAWASLKRLG